MQRQKKAIALSMLMVVSSANVSGQSSIDNFVQGACAVGLGLLGVAGAVKLAEWCFTETNAQLVVRGQAEYNNALRYTDIMSEYERIYGVNDYFYACYDGHAVRDVSEPHLYQLATGIWNKGLSHTSYIKEVTNAKNQLQALSSKLNERINDLRGKHLDRNDMRDLDAMRILARKVDTFLPRLKLGSEFFEYHKNYFALYECESNLYKKYDTEIRIMQSGNYSSVASYDVRQEIMWRYNRNKYPFTVFVTQLNSNLSVLKSHVKAAEYRYSERVRCAQALYDCLEWIKRVVVVDDRYQQEVYQAEQERLERIRIQLLQDQARVEQAQLQEMRKQNRLLQENNNLKRQELLHNNQLASGVDVTINVAL